jgi:hypothetical protein
MGIPPKPFDRFYRLQTDTPDSCTIIYKGIFSPLTRFLQFSFENKNIFIRNPLILKIVHQFFDEMNAQPADLAILDAALKIRRLGFQRIKRDPIVLYPHLHLIPIDGNADFNDMFPAVVETIRNNVGKQFIKGKIHFKDGLVRDIDGPAYFFTVLAQVLQLGQIIFQLKGITLLDHLPSPSRNIILGTGISYHLSHINRHDSPAYLYSKLTPKC